jgi:hypothetical protein
MTVVCDAEPEAKYLNRRARREKSKAHLCFAMRADGAFIARPQLRAIQAARALQLFSVSLGAPVRHC